MLRKPKKPPIEISNKESIFTFSPPYYGPSVISIKTTKAGP